MNLIIKAAQFAQKAHEGQFRKAPSNEPYIYHCGRVAMRTALLTDATEEMVAAAWLHDTIEDCDVSLLNIQMQFNSMEITNLVDELTNVSKKLSGISRVKRKAMDREKLSIVSSEAKKIKLIDRIDNIQSLINYSDPDFVSLYLTESDLLAEVLRNGDEKLYIELKIAIANRQKV